VSGPLTSAQLAQPLDTVLFEGSPASLLTVLDQLAQRPGPIVNVFAVDDPQAPLPAEAVWVERSLSINTAAAGGNASLTALGPT